VSDLGFQPHEEPESEGRRGSGLLRFARWELFLVVLLAGTVAYGNHVSPYFLEWSNLFFICLNVGEVAIIALPLTLIVITGEIDLSVASILGLCGVVMAELFKHGWEMWPAMGVAVLLGAVLGAFNGVLVTRIGLPSLAVTIGTLTLYRGVAQGILPTDTIGGFPTYLTNIGVLPIGGTHVSWSIAFFAVLAVIFAVVLHATPLGRAIFAIGAGQEAAFFAGIRVKRIKLVLFVLSGVVSAFAGAIYTLRYGSARADNGLGMELAVIAAVLLGGVDFDGGRGTLGGVVAGVLLIGLLRNLLMLRDVATEIQSIVTGLLLIVSVLTPRIVAGVREARRHPRGSVSASSQ
jgi:rhamnose transport system permease protein